MYWRILDGGGLSLGEGVGCGLKDALHVDKLFRDDETVVADKSAARCSDSLLAVGCEGDVRDAGVAAVERPLRLAVADDEAARRRHFRPLSWT